MRCTAFLAPTGPRETADRTPGDEALWLVPNATAAH